MDGRCLPLCIEARRSEVLLADIGNTYFHIYDGNRVEHLSYAEAIERYRDMPLYYISVKHDLEIKMTQMKKWKNISNAIFIEGEYETMGVDRKALCLSHKEGVFVDAGSAITVDVIEGELYRGGYILPGLQAYLQSYTTISSALDVSLDEKIALDRLPRTTKEQISYGIIASIKVLIDKHRNAKKLYFTGGDGKFLSTLFDDALYDETLVFQGMMKAIKDKKIC